MRLDSRDVLLMEAVLVSQGRRSNYPTGRNYGRRGVREGVPIRGAELPAERLERS